jgi:hypothetical protein
MNIKLWAVLVSEDISSECIYHSGQSLPFLKTYGVNIYNIVENFNSNSDVYIIHNDSSENWYFQRHVEPLYIKSIVLLFTHNKKAIKHTTTTNQ